MTRWEIANPSDPYTFSAVGHEVAALVICLLGSLYGADELDDQWEEMEGGRRVPIDIYGGRDQWFAEMFGRTPEEGLEALLPEVADALDSVLIGSALDRRRMDRVLAAIAEEGREAAREAWHDEKRSSLNDIGAWCRSAARGIREGLATTETP